MRSFQFLTRRLILGLLLVPASYGMCVAGSGPTPCDTPSILVETGDLALHERVCNVAQAAQPELEACHLKLEKPIVFDFELDTIQSGPACLGLYHAGDHRISLLTPQAFRKAHRDSDYCERIPEAEHFDSIVVHELAHAMLDQTAHAATTSRTNHEYIAYAMQLESLRTATRDRLLGSLELSQPVSEERLNQFILDVSPVMFAAAAWLHFSAPENGCDFVGRIVRGEYSLWKTPF